MRRFSQGNKINLNTEVFELRGTNERDLSVLKIRVYVRDFSLPVVNYKDFAGTAL